MAKNRAGLKPLNERLIDYCSGRLRKMAGTVLGKTGLYSGEIAFILADDPDWKITVQGWPSEEMPLPDGRCVYLAAMPFSDIAELRLIDSGQGQGIFLSTPVKSVNVYVVCGDDANWFTIPLFRTEVFWGEDSSDNSSGGRERLDLYNRIMNSPVWLKRHFGDEVYDSSLVLLAIGKGGQGNNMLQSLFDSSEGTPLPDGKMVYLLERESLAISLKLILNGEAGEFLERANGPLDAVIAAGWDLSVFAAG